MIGAIIGDIAGSRFEWDNYRAKDFELFTDACFPYSDDPQPYHSFGNGAAMRISAVGFAARNMNEVKTLSRAVTAISHDHPEGLKGAESVAMAIFLARQSKTKRQIRGYIEQNYYKIGFTLDEIRGTYEFNETCQNTVPQAFEAFFEAKDFEDAIRNAVFRHTIRFTEKGGKLS